MQTDKQKQERYGVDEDMKPYFYERNTQLYQALDKGMKRKEASTIFGLAPRTIKNMWKKQRHLYPTMFPGFYKNRTRR